MEKEVRHKLTVVLLGLFVATASLYAGDYAIHITRKQWVGVIIAAVGGAVWVGACAYVFVYNLRAVEGLSWKLIFSRAAQWTGFFLLLALLYPIAAGVWWRHTHNATATVVQVRAVGSDLDIYLNDGTVWAVPRETAESFYVASGDRIRFENPGMSPPVGDGFSGEECLLHDSTRYQEAVMATRATGNPKRDSCPP